MDDSSTSSDDAPLVTQDSLPEPTKLRDVCRCKNSKCLKRYCVCFERGDACRDTCECVNCENTKDSAVAKQQRRAAASRKRKVTEGGCTCKKSRCLKRYCDCFRAGIKCVAECKCLDCQNGRPAVDQVLAPRAPPSMVLPPSPHPLKRAATAPPAPTPNKIGAAEALQALFNATPAPAARFVSTEARPASPFLAIGEPGVTVVGPSSGSPPLARSATTVTDRAEIKFTARSSSQHPTHWLISTQVTEDRDSPKSVLASLETTRFCHFITDAPLGVVLEPTDDGGVVVKSVTPDGCAASSFSPSCRVDGVRSRVLTTQARRRRASASRSASASGA